ncbi:MAG: DNA repair protein RecO [Gemmatimonadales bacterium]|nr:DNA repair protein RecO [Gemmatimonadales bacterium]
MPLVSSPAIVLGAVRYGESSKIVRLATRAHGLQSAMAKGALRPRSRFGAALQLLSEGTAQYVAREARELHTLTAFDVQHVRAGLASHVGRYASAAALGELMLRLASGEPDHDAFDLLSSSIALLEAVPGEAVGVVGVRALWRLAASLGFAPALGTCARDAGPVPGDGPVAFSAADGGVLCRACARERRTIELPADARATLVQLLDPGADVPWLDQRHLAAHRRLLARWVRTHVAEERELPALEFWLHEGAARP